MWTRLEGLDMPDADELSRAKVGGRVLVVANHQGRLCALDDRCPHAGASLSAVGRVEDGQLICAWHGRAYDLATGACDGYQGLQAYPVEVRSDGVYVQLGDQATSPDART